MPARLIRTEEGDVWRDPHLGPEWNTATITTEDGFRVRLPYANGRINDQYESAKEFVTPIISTQFPTGKALNTGNYDTSSFKEPISGSDSEVLRPVSKSPSFILKFKMQFELNWSKLRNFFGTFLDFFENIGNQISNCFPKSNLVRFLLIIAILLLFAPNIARNSFKRIACGIVYSIYCYFQFTGYILTSLYSLIIGNCCKVSIRSPHIH